MNIARSRKHMYLLIVLCLIIIGLTAIIAALAYVEQQRVHSISQNKATTRQQTSSRETGDSHSDITQAEPDSTNTPPDTGPKTDQNETTHTAPARVREDVDGAQQQ